MPKVFMISVQTANQGFVWYWSIDKGMAFNLVDRTIKVEASSIDELIGLSTTGNVATMEMCKGIPVALFERVTLDTEIGNYRPRIWRPYHEHESGDTNKPPNDPLQLSDAIRQARILWRDLQYIFEHVHPDVRNYQAFGDRIRNVILLLVTEVESQLRGILRANHYKAAGAKRLKLDDYHQLEPHALLSEYVLAFGQYRGLGDFIPFKAFAKNESPRWWADYNKIKHDRFENQAAASLENALAAFSAFAVTILAQHGYEALHENQDGFMLGNVLTPKNYPSRQEFLLFRDGHRDWTPAPIFQR